jgi:hypothetical protein
MSSPDMIKKLMTVCGKHGIDEETRHCMILDWTNGRTESSRLMQNQEIDDLVWKLNNDAGFRAKEQTSDHQRGDKQRKYLMSLCYQLGWTKFSERAQRDVADVARLNNWCQKYGYLHKPLNGYKYTELTKLVTQFEEMVEKHLAKV